MCALRRQPQRDGAPNTAGCSGDQGDFPLQFHTPALLHTVVKTSVTVYGRRGLRAVTPANSSIRVIIAAWSQSPRPAYCTAWNSSLTTLVTGRETLSLRAICMA